MPLLLEKLQEQLTNLVAGTDLHTIKLTVRPPTAPGPHFEDIHGFLMRHQRQ
jgi:hypothetical protein